MERPLRIQVLMEESKRDQWINPVEFRSVVVYYEQCIAELEAEILRLAERLHDKEALKAAWDAAIDEMVIGTAAGHTFESWYRETYERLLPKKF